MAVLEPNKEQSPQNEDSEAVELDEGVVDQQKQAAVFRVKQAIIKEFLRLGEGGNLGFDVEDNDTRNESISLALKRLADPDALTCVTHMGVENRVFVHFQVTVPETDNIVTFYPTGKGKKYRFFALSSPKDVKTYLEAAAAETLAARKKDPETRLDYSLEAYNLTFDCRTLGTNHEWDVKNAEMALAAIQQKTPEDLVANCTAGMSILGHIESFARELKKMAKRNPGFAVSNYITKETKEESSTQVRQ